MSDEMDNYEDFFEFIDFACDNGRIPKRYIRDYDNPFEKYFNWQFEMRYRFSKDVVKNIIAPLVPEAQNRNKRGLPISHLHKILIALRFYATGNFQLVCGDLKGISQSSVSRIVNFVSEHLSRQQKKFISFQSTEESFQSNTNWFYKIGNFPNVVGCIDCTHIPIKSPGGERAEIFRNRKGFFSINVQCVVGPNLEIMDIVARWPGSAHDSRIFDNSNVKLNFDDGIIKGFLLGDSGYRQSAYMFTPVLNPTSRAENNYNRAHKSTRSTVERMFGIWKKKFPCLSRTLGNNVKNSLRIITVCAVLFNIYVKSGCTDDDMYEEEIPDYPVLPLDINVRNLAIRQAFIQRHFL